MKKIILYSPSISSMNLGDAVIYDSILRELTPLLKDAFLVEFGTHTPVPRRYLKYFRGADLKFVCGSNLMRGKLNRKFRQWDINLLNADLIGPVVLIGVGWWQYNDDPNLYTEAVYKRILSSQYFHSVRDDYTKKMLESIGVTNIINTGCPATWGLTEEHCNGIPAQKAQDAVLTVTDYKKDILHDNKMIEIVSGNYEQVYVWPQGWNDAEYLSQLSIPENFIMVPPSLEAYDKILDRDIDYIGTRLHGGIRALQKQKRTIIVSVDNRAEEMRKNININCIARDQIEQLDSMINSAFRTEIKLPLENIDKWKSQFQ